MLFLARIKLNNNIKRYFQNSSTEDLVFAGRAYKYCPFNPPPLARIMGEQSETISLNLPLISAAEYAYFPLKEWVLSGDLDNAFITFTIFDLNNTIYRHSFMVAEQVIQTIENRSIVELRLRQPDDSNATIMTTTYSYKNIGEAPTYSAF